MFRRSVLILLSAAAAVLAVPAAAFAPPTRTVVRSSSSTKNKALDMVDNTKQAPSLFPAIKDIPYGEASRKFRRTVFTHDDWRRYRSPDRFFSSLATFTSSGVYKSVAREVLVTTAIATFIVVYNCLVGGYADFSGMKHDAIFNNPLLPLIGLPLAPFTLSSPALGLLLGE